MTVDTSIECHSNGAISCIETHTVGMPCRIVTKGFPRQTGTLLEQRCEAEASYDYIRKRILLEPRGHADMFGAVLRPHTESTASGEAHMGVFYIHRAGYSKMCSHATLAVSRALIDIHDPEIFPQRHLVKNDAITQTSTIILHTLGGLVKATVPTTADGQRSDPSRPVTFVAVPSFAIATDLNVVIPPGYRWPELGNRTSVNASLAYCSAFSCQTQLHELGFPPQTLQGGTVPLQDLKYAVSQLKKVLGEPKYQKYFTNPSTGESSSCFGVLIADKGLGQRSKGSEGVETGLYIFGDGVLDRSPTGSVSAARNAVAFAKGELGPGQSWTYHSLLSNTLKRKEGFTATVIRGEGRREIEEGGFAAGPVVVEVQGSAYYTGFHTFVVEDEDPLGSGGFTYGDLAS
ncbi:hypothetical protein CEP54_009927 [Fusarium duplospermum]|uniref:trans-L-3-hydroxyproline dehydratase n=1 Tax=Fusarium duplospermum TaxID=1325734 RepID=A0A428PMY1_9HYPO|nr:hypothetical protein CEP54_009927 [Fusarium duplospermum]